MRCAYCALRPSIALTVNDEEVRETVGVRTSLVDFLRERLGPTGSHVGCEQGVTLTTRRWRTLPPSKPLRKPSAPAGRSASCRSRSVIHGRRRRKRRSRRQ
jgi:hypothetical protein